MCKNQEEKGNVSRGSVVSKLSKLTSQFSLFYKVGALKKIFSNKLLSVDAENYTTHSIELSSS